MRAHKLTNPIPSENPMKHNFTAQEIDLWIESLRENPDEATAVLIRLARRISECEDHDEVMEWCGNSILKTDVFREAIDLLSKVLDILDPEGGDPWFSQEKFHEWLNERVLSSNRRIP